MPAAMYPADVPRHVKEWHTVFCHVFNTKTHTWRMRRCQIAWCTVLVEVQYPDGAVAEVPLTLVIIRRGGHTMFLLTHRTIDDANDPVALATMLYETYLARWSVEMCFDLHSRR